MTIQTIEVEKDTRYVINDGELILTEEQALELRDELTKLLVDTGK